ncbi:MULTISPECIES: pilus assembly protein TadG-related protein [unclassified Micromonospora]|uniref:pilus assembly protein TadG-related protein n=1 Tax=unclassified Micromonospora TaxID=2617518 RepID=UPI0022B6F7A7|nr:MULTISPECIES: pilus assembly protein TadG-related protein [unclassified Micromonospora]MCZ7421527.1 pilus assembly protein TadG-related protein [Verrucosispora sp. WMMA2121]WBB93786.1 pilus assembly protein TadG-related protein [Verrucosispora sp. WMMC514]
MTAARGDAGRVSIFLAVALIGVLAIIGMAFDGAGQLRTLQRAENLAAEAARAGGQAIDRATAIEGGPKRINRREARNAVRNYLTTAGASHHTVTFPVVDGETLIRVRVEVTYDRAALGLFGFSNTVTVSGEATARALTGAS